ncbi:MAG TPA: purine-nucleoside phosphorylase [bacterium]|nr:purine-nucleoside phosphorylase [bacterium]
MSEWEKVNKAVEYIRSKSKVVPEIGIILGTGLGEFGKTIEDVIVIPYKNIPDFPVSTVESHEGNLLIGKIGNKNVVAMQGRFHLYEGYSAVQISFPIRVMKQLGIKTLFESNASGGLNPLFERGDIVIITDHINLTGYNPLVGENDERFGPRFPDMSNPYSKNLIELAEDIAIENKIKIKKGVLVGLLGPNLETKAEYRFLRLIGADMVCMSTVVEVIAAVHLGLNVFGVSVITDMGLPDALKPLTFDEIVEIANSSEPKLTKLFKNIIINY